jgi:hypothetical protein
MFTMVSIMGVFGGISTFTSISLLASFPGLFDESSDRSEITSFLDMLREQQGDKGGRKGLENGKELERTIKHSL